MTGYVYASMKASWTVHLPARRLLLLMAIALVRKPKPCIVQAASSAVVLGDRGDYAL